MRECQWDFDWERLGYSPCNECDTCDECVWYAEIKCDAEDEDGAEE